MEFSYLLKNAMIVTFWETMDVALSAYLKIIQFVTLLTIAAIAHSAPLKATLTPITVHVLLAPTTTVKHAILQGSVYHVGLTLTEPSTMPRTDAYQMMDFMIVVLTT